MNRKHLLIAISASFALSACGSNDGSPEAGEYQQTVKITELNFPDMTEEVKQQTIIQMEQAAGGGSGGLFCMNGDDGGAQWKQAASQMASTLGGDCETKKDNGSATRLDLEMVCKETAQGDIQISMSGDANKNGYESSMTFDLKHPVSGDTARIAMNIGAKRVGDCPAE